VSSPARAARAGMSLDSYLRAELIALAERLHHAELMDERPTNAEWVEQVRERVERMGAHLSREDIIRLRDEARAALG
jgi:hypothetical protein